MTREADLRTGLRTVRERIAAAAGAAGRDPGEVTLIVVTKFFPASDVALLHGLGVRDVGESRHQEAVQKVDELSGLSGLSGPAGEGDPGARRLRWHFIGGLQSNKAAAVAGYSDAVQSVDRAKLLTGLSRGAVESDRTVDVTVQVDLDPTGADPGRAGSVPEDVPALADAVADAEGLRLRGVMAVAPLGADPGAAFARLAEVAARVRSDHPGATWVSAGMSGDLEPAIDAGATHVRVGSAVLGERPSRR